MKEADWYKNFPVISSNHPLAIHEAMWEQIYQAFKKRMEEEATPQGNEREWEDETID